MGEAFDARKNQNALRTASLDKVSDIAIERQFIP